MYPACNANAPYCHLWPDQLYYFFSHYLINGTIFEKKRVNVKCVLIFSANLFEEFLVLRRTEWDMTKMCIGIHVK